MIPPYVIKTLAITMIPMIPKIINEAYNLISGYISDDEEKEKKETIVTEGKREPKKAVKVPWAKGDPVEDTPIGTITKKKKIKKKSNKRDMYKFSEEQREEIRVAFYRYNDIFDNALYHRDLTREEFVTLLNKKYGRHKSLTAYRDIWISEKETL